MKKIISVLTLVLFLSVVTKAQETGTFTDNRDKKTYKTVKIGSQTWFAENLDFDCGYDCWKPEREGRGKLYTYSTAYGYCPYGWHLPTLEEWNTLISLTGGENYAGGKLKSSNNGWRQLSNGTDNYGFNAYGSGVRDPSTGKINRIDERAYFWTSTKSGSENAYYIMIVNDDVAIKSFENSKTGGQSVRCVKD